MRSGSNGVEAAMIFIAAILAFPASWNHRVIGIVAGLFAVQLLNIVRVMHFFYLGQWNMAAFDWAHLNLWPALCILNALMVWIIWIRTLPTVTARIPTPAEDEVGLQPETSR